ncbi:Subtilase family protein [Maledivibacter halophilus]|uniref:Subtilase family protein n=1 Tax=Maledivibacter halophilus TaxID=36842 RepID=A0A1T5MHZ1_9FIRM|nr:Subtilase family protein [Maledivibacter halophilus]
MVSDGRVLVHSLKKILLYSPDIIHLSLGTTSPRYIFQLKRIVRKAIKKNIIIVCSANNHGLKSYPAYLKGVVGVKASSNDINAGIKYENGFFYAPSMVIDEFNLINISKRKQLKGTSISAAYITGCLALIKYEQGSIKNDDIIEKLKVLIKGGIYNASK